MLLILSRQSIAIYDKDRDGLISKQDLQDNLTGDYSFQVTKGYYWQKPRTGMYKIVKNMGLDIPNTFNEYVDTIFDKIDSEKTGQISLEQYLKCLHFFITETK